MKFQFVALINEDDEAYSEIELSQCDPISDSESSVGISYGTLNILSYSFENSYAPILSFLKASLANAFLVSIFFPCDAD